MNTKRKMFIKEWGISILTFALAISTFLGSAFYLKPYLANATEVTSDGIEIISTNDSNIEFSTYFINEDEEKVETLNTEIDKNTYLYVDVTVLNEGYFNGAITLNNSNFKFVEDAESEGVSEITEDSITLEQINAGETRTIKVEVEPIIGDEITLNNLTTETEVTLNGEYVNSKNIEKNKYEEILGSGKVSLRWVSSDEIEAEISTELLTNSIYEINDEEKRIVQILVNSKIANNSYPVYSSVIKLTVPENVEEIEVTARSLDGTNSNEEFGAENYTYNEEEKILEITVDNKDTENISWNKEDEDIFLITYVFDVNEYITEENIDVNSVITTYDSKELTAEEKVELKQTENIDGVITYNVSTNDTNIYKGNLYAGEDKEYSVTNEINVNYLNVIDKIILNCNESTYLAGEQEGSANIVYTSTKINKENFVEIFGEDGYLIIKEHNGNEVTITNETETDEEGNIIISFDEKTKNIEIETSEPKQIGTLKLEQTKKIENTGYTRQTIDAMTEIKETITGISYAKWSETEDETTEETRITLEDTKTKANLKIDTTTISTTADSQTITLCAILDSSDETKNLYKNPAVRITLPEEIEVISAQYAVICKNGLTVGEKSIKENENGQYEITINLEGEQVEYDTSRGGTRIYFKLEISTSTLTPTKVDNIEMAYTNEYTGEVKSTNTEINFESQYGLMIYNQLTNYGDDGEKLVTIDKETAQATIEKDADSKEISIGTAIINNYGTEISNVEIIGSVPAEENSTFLSSINSVVTDKEGVEILYSTKADIDSDDESWGEYTQDCVSYKIVIENMEAEEVIKLSITSSIPADLGYNEEGYFKTTTICTYNEKQEENTSTMLLTTETTDAIITQTKTENGLDVEIAAYLGDTSISEEDTVYEGETIRYEVTVTNNSGVDYTNVEIKAEQTNGYVWDYISTEVYNPYYDQIGEEAYYNENYYEISDYNERTIDTIENFVNGECYSFEYESSTYLLSNEKINGTETYGTVSISSEDEDLGEKIETIKSEIMEAELQINIDHLWSTDIEITSGLRIQSSIEITNLTKTKLTNLKLEVTFSSDLIADWSLTSENRDYITYTEQESNENGDTIVNFVISEIDAGQSISMCVTPYIEEMTEKSEDISITSKVISEENKEYVSNKLVRTIYNDSYDTELNQEGIHEDGTIIDTEQDVVFDGEKVEFIVTIKNNEEQDFNINIIYNIDQNIEFESGTIVYNGEESDVSDELDFRDLIFQDLTLNAQQTITLKVVGTINAYDVEKITNRLNIYNYANEKSTTSEYTVNVDTVTDSFEDDTNTSDDEEESIIYVDKESNSKDNDEDEDKDNIEENNIEENNEDENILDENSTNDNVSVNISDNDINDTEVVSTYTVSGIAWLDSSKDGIRDSSEEIISDLEVLAINANTKKTIGTTVTDSNGEYEFTLDEGNYIIVFLYDNTLYTATTYQSSDDSYTASNALEESIEIDGYTQIAGVTDTISLTENLININIGLVTKETFDLNISKYVNKITISNETGITEYEQSEGTTLAKAEIKSKYINSSIVEIEYTIQITNAGEIAGYANTISDDMPSGLEFDETLNSGWFLENGKLYNTNLSNEKIEPGETKELTLILTKEMTESNIGLINNNAEIESSSSESGLEDETENKAQANVIISISTGAATYAIGTIIIIAIIGICVFVINKEILHKRI